MASPPQLAALRGVRVFVTGQMGFKGAWLSAFLHELGAQVHGFDLGPPARGAFHDLGVSEFVSSATGDVRDASVVDAAVGAAKPDVVFHLAAQPLVRRAWADRRATFATNVTGTVNVVEAALSTASVRGVIVVTTDKVYANDGSGTPFVETDRLGGHDPYSASKAAAELALEPYRHSELMGLSGAPVVSVRAGNVIGGGDRSEDRLLPDIVRALEAGDKLVLRRPDAVRPWQHVLDCVHGYLLVAAAVLEGRALAPAYNFANADSMATVLEVARMAVRAWGAEDDVIVVERDESAAEAGLLQLDASLAKRDLRWAARFDVQGAITQSVAGYKDPTVGRSQVTDHITALI